VSKSSESTAEKLSTERKIYLRDQMITMQDLQEFKLEFLNEIKKLLQPQNVLYTKPWLKGSEVRKLLSISEGKLQSLRVSGKLPSSRIGSVHYYKHEHIDKMLEEGTE
jgi:hypothetical protein